MRGGWVVYSSVIDWDDAVAKTAAAADVYSLCV